MIYAPWPLPSKAANCRRGWSYATRSFHIESDTLEPGGVGSIGKATLTPTLSLKGEEVS